MAGARAEMVGEMSYSRDRPEITGLEFRIRQNIQLP